MPAERELPRALWQATGVALALQGALCCGSLALVTGASPCFLGIFFGVGLFLARCLEVWIWLIFLLWRGECGGVGVDGGGWGVPL